MTLTAEDWEALDLDPESIMERAEFFEAFARLAADPPPFQASQLAELSRFRDPSPGLESFGDPPGADRLESVVARLTEVPESPERPRWQRAGFEADALRQAGSAALLLDTRRGLRLLARAAELYQVANPSFAMLLEAATDPDPRRDVAETALGALRRSNSTEAGGRLSYDFGPIGETQEINFALAASSVAGMVSDDLLGDFAERPGARSSASFGAGSATVAEWWQLAGNLLDGARRRGPESRSRKEIRPIPWEAPPGGQGSMLVTDLDRIAVGHGRQLEAARLDTYHWHKFGGPAELIDLDLACAVCIASRQVADLEDRRLSIKEFDLPTPTRISVRVGLEMAESDEEPPPGAVASEPPLAHS